MRRSTIRGASKFVGLAKLKKTIDARIAELRRRHAILNESVARGHVERIDDVFRDVALFAARTSRGYLAEAREAGLRAVDEHRGALSAKAGDRLDELVRERDPQGLGGRYLSAVGDSGVSHARS